MGSRVGVPVRVRRVSSELRELRLRAGLGAEEVSAALGISMSKLSRMENGQRGLQADDVSALLGLYRVSAQRREELLELVRNAAKPNWWQVQRGRIPELDDLSCFERTAKAFRTYETMLIPGLLQIPEYLVALAEASARGFTQREIDQLVRGRAERQHILHSRPHQWFEFFIEETALARGTGGVGVMYRQLQHLATVLTRDNVEVRVMPASVGAHPGMDGPFVVLEFEGHQNLVYLENRGASSFLEEPEYVAEAEDVLAELRKVALSSDESGKLITQLAAQLT